MKLEIFQDQIQTFILNSLTIAEKEFDGINSLGIYISPVIGWISINVNYNTKIEQTSFNCPDFDHVEFQLLDLSEWVDEAEKEDPIFTYGNKTLNWNGEDETLNKFIFNYFVGWIIPSITENFTKPLLLQMLDSKYSNIWNVDTNVQTEFENIHETFEPKEINLANTKLFKWIKSFFT